MEDQVSKYRARGLQVAFVAACKPFVVDLSHRKELQVQVQVQGKLNSLLCRLKGLGMRCYDSIIDYLKTKNLMIAENY